jgi:hypothetical protein
MSASEIKQLRIEGKLEEALALATKEYDEAIARLPSVEEDGALSKLKALSNQASLLWPKRNLSWVYYEFVKKNSEPGQFDVFLSNLNNIKELELPADEQMLLDQVSWQVGKMVFALLRQESIDKNKLDLVFDAIQHFHYKQPSEGYSFLFKSFQKAFKDTDKYIQFVDWWQLKNLRPEDFQPEKMADGKELMSVAEQAYMTYAKHLLPKQTPFGEVVFNKEEVESFLPILSDVIENYPQFQYPAYYKAKLLLALGDRDNMPSALLPFAKKKRNDFWVWEILSEVFPDDPEKVMACLCKALSCKSPEEMLINIREKMAAIFIQNQLYDEARTEIDHLINARNAKGYRVPGRVAGWQAQEWYKKASTKPSNLNFYKQHFRITDAILFSDIPEETVIVEFVNSDKKMLNFIASETKFGFFKYDRSIGDVAIGDTLKVRFNGNGAENGLYQVYTVEKINDEALRKKYLKDVTGKVELPIDKPHGFVNHIFIHPATVKRFNLKNNQEIKAKAISSYQSDRKQWSWKVYEIM